MRKTTIKNEKANKSNYGKFMLIIASIILLGAFVFSACGVSKTATNTAVNSPNKAAVNDKAANVPEKTSVIKTPSDSAPPQVLADAGEFAENIYDYAKAKNWTKADEAITNLEKSVKELKTKNLAESQLVEATNSLAVAVKEKNEINAMQDANQATFLIAEQMGQFKLAVPVEVIKLDYYGREIEILAMTKDEAKLKSTALAIRKTWNDVKPKIEAKGASIEAKKFESLVVQTEKAASVAEYAKVATPILDEVDNLEKVFE